MIATYRKLANGNWGVAVSIALTLQQPNVNIAPGAVIPVTKRDGTTKQVTLGACVGQSEGWLAYEIANTPAPAATNVGETAAIYALFGKAKQTLKFPAVELSVDGYTPIRISVAGDKAREPGSLTVTSVEKFDEAGSAFPRRRWYGRISKDGTFQPSRDMNPAYTAAVAARLAAFAADPAKVGGEDGKLHGNCCFCRKALSDERSTLAGYGAKCATNWGLAWGERPSSFACAEVAA